MALQDAEKYLKKAIDIDPHISSYRGNLGNHMYPQFNNITPYQQVYYTIGWDNISYLNEAIATR